MVNRETTSQETVGTRPGHSVALESNVMRMETTSKGGWCRVPDLSRMGDDPCFYQVQVMAEARLSGDRVREELQRCLGDRTIECLVMEELLRPEVCSLYSGTGGPPHISHAYHGLIRLVDGKGVISIDQREKLRRLTGYFCREPELCGSVSRWMKCHLGVTSSSLVDYFSTKTVVAGEANTLLCWEEEASERDGWCECFWFDFVELDEEESNGDEYDTGES